jgi:hypothetical protein
MPISDRHLQMSARDRFGALWAYMLGKNLQLLGETNKKKRKNFNGFFEKKFDFFLIFCWICWFVGEFSIGLVVVWGLFFY